MIKLSVKSVYVTACAKDAPCEAALTGHADGRSCADYGFVRIGWSVWGSGMTGGTNNPLASYRIGGIHPRKSGAIAERDWFETQ